MLKIFVFLIGLFYFIYEIESHGFLIDPPARSSAYREDSLRFPVYYTDTEMNCGGKSVQWNQNDGNCGICGENSALPKRYELGGDRYRGYRVRNYPMNGKIPISVYIWTNHRGWYEFRLCKVDDQPSGEADHACLDKILLADESGRTRFDTPSQVEGWRGFFNTTLVTPENFVCDHCVLQWKWNVGNSYGIDFVTGENCLGCGPQEQFYGCSDIRIFDGIIVTKPASTTKPAIDPNAGAVWSQCGGLGFSGSKSCQAGLDCVYDNDYYSQCRPASPKSSTRAQSSTRISATIRSDSTTTKTTQTRSPATTATTATKTKYQSANSNLGAVWSQCGGINWQGPFECQVGLDCVYLNEWYSQCKPSNQDHTTSTARTTTSSQRANQNQGAIWAQCGGINWNGPFDCQSGLQCFKFNDWYSQCIPV